jgi:glycosyltransferase involved in cell wall biosynthesis
MVEQLLEVCGGDRRSASSSSKMRGVECYHVDCRYSDEMGDVGRAGWQKVFRLLKYCAEALWCRARHGATDFLYIPAPGIRTPLYRDWMVMALCRPFFRRRIFYWQAAGLGEWLATHARFWERWLSRLLLGHPDLSIVLGDYCRGDATYFESRRVAVVPNCIPDPCPRFDMEVRPMRQARAKRRTELAISAGASGTGASVEVYRVLFIGLCTRDKGLFDALDATAFANQELARRGVGIRIQLSVAGKFWREDERSEYEQRILRTDLAGSLGDTGEPVVRYLGFVAGEQKRRLFQDSDCLCFPTYYQAESFGIVLIEAMAHGLQIVTTRWRTIPELFPEGFSGLVDPRAPSQVAAALLTSLAQDYDASLRDNYLLRFSRPRFVQNIEAALSTV